MLIIGKVGGPKRGQLGGMDFSMMMTHSVFIPDQLFLSDLIRSKLLSLVDEMICPCQFKKTNFCHKGFISFELCQLILQKACC